MPFVLRLGAELANASLVVPAEHLQQPLVLLAHPVLQVLHRRHQLVEHQGGDSVVGLQVRLAVRCQTDQTGLVSLHLHGRCRAHVTQHVSRVGGGQRRGGRAHYDLLERVGQLFEGRVDADLRRAAKLFVAGGTPADVTAVPQTLDASLAEVVAARCGDWVGEDLLADGAEELLFWQHIAGGGHCLPSQEKKKEINQSPRNAVYLEIVAVKG